MGGQLGTMNIHAQGFGGLLGGPRDLVTTYNWAHNPTCNPPKWAYRTYPKYK